MTIGLLGKKLGMTQIFQPDGTVIPVTIVQAGPCKVLQVKTTDVSELPEEDRSATTNRGKRSGKVERPRRADGYYAVQVGFEEIPEKASTKPLIGHARKAGVGPQRLIREFRLDQAPEMKAGDDLTIAMFADGDRVDVTGTSKGRGFTGTIKRHGFARQSQSHGNSKSHRRQGGIGRTYSTMKGVPKGKKMPGHHGVDRITVQNLDIIKADAERNLLYLRGAVPGHRNGYIILQKSIKTR